MKVIVCGGRNWSDFGIIRRELSKLPKDTIVIHGGASGADKIGEHVALDLGFMTKSFPALWNVHGKKAGILRNLDMIREVPDLVLAFHKNINESKGTKHTVNEARKRGITVKIIEG